jgi:hypothetical protein
MQSCSLEKATSSFEAMLASSLAVPAMLGNNDLAAAALSGRRLSHTIQSKQPILASDIYVRGSARSQLVLHAWSWKE